MHTALASGVFGGQTEGVPAHRMQHGETTRPLVARHHVTERVVAHMAHVDLARRIREHLQHVVFGFAVSRHVFHAEAGCCVPGSLPTRFGGAEIVAWSVSDRVCGCVGGDVGDGGRGGHGKPDTERQKSTLSIGQNGLWGNIQSRRADKQSAVRWFPPYAFDQPPTLCVRNSRARVRTLSSNSFCVPTLTGASTHWPPLLI